MKRDFKEYMKRVHIYGKRPIYIHTGPAGGGQAKHADPDLSTYEEKKTCTHEKRAVYIFKETYMYVHRPCVRRTRRTSRPRPIYIPVYI